MEHFLLRSQQDAVFGAIEEVGFDPSDFSWHDVTGRVFLGTIPVLVHNPSKSNFKFDFEGKRNHHYAEYMPGAERPVDAINAGDWTTELGLVREWLKNVQREASSPNFWAQLRRAERLAIATEPRDVHNNAPFTEEERAQIAGQLNEIRELLTRTQQLEGERLRAIESRLDYLRDASTRMGRRDWLTLFYGTTFSWILTRLVSPDAVQEVLVVTAHTIGHLFGGGLPQLPVA